MALGERPREPSRLLVMRGVGAVPLPGDRRAGPGAPAALTEVTARIRARVAREVAGFERSMKRSGSDYPFRGTAQELQALNDRSRQAVGDQAAAKVCCADCGASNLVGRSHCWNCEAWLGGSAADPATRRQMLAVPPVRAPEALTVWVVCSCHGTHGLRVGHA